MNLNQFLKYRGGEITAYSKASVTNIFPLYISRGFLGNRFYYKLSTFSLNRVSFNLTNYHWSLPYNLPKILDALCFFTPENFTKQSLTGFKSQDLWLDARQHVCFKEQNHELMFRLSAEESLKTVRFSPTFCAQLKLYIITLPSIV